MVVSTIKDIVDKIFDKIKILRLKNCKVDN